MRGLPPLPLSSHLNYKKDDPGASGCVALRCTTTKSGEIRGKGRGNVFRRGGRKREKVENVLGFGFGRGFVRGGIWRVWGKENWENWEEVMVKFGFEKLRMQD